MKASMNSVRRILPCFLLVCMLTLAACGGSSSAQSTQNGTATATQHVALHIFAASSLTESFQEIQQNYKKLHPNVTITYNFNGSQDLEQQIANGANCDIFASADQTNMQKATTANLVEKNVTFAQNRLTVIVPNSNPGHISSLKDLAKPGLKIVMGAPAVPIGKYGLQILDKLGASSQYGATYEKGVKANVVSQEENVKAVVQKVQLGDADAGIVYVTDVTSDASKQVSMITIPDQYNVIASYPVAITRSSTQKKAAQDFINYLLSPTGQAVLVKYHFITVLKNG